MDDGDTLSSVDVEFKHCAVLSNFLYSLAIRNQQLLYTSLDSTVIDQQSNLPGHAPRVLPNAVLEYNVDPMRCSVHRRWDISLDCCKNGDINAHVQ